MSNLRRSFILKCRRLTGKPINKFDLAKEYTLAFIEDIWFDYIRRPIRRIYLAYRYARQGWGTSNFDYYYLLEDIRFKLRLIAEDIHKYGNTSSSKEVVKQNLKLRVMLGNLQNLDPFIGAKYDKLLEEKYGPYESWREAGDFKMQRKKIRDNPELEEEYHKDFNKYMDLTHKESLAYEKRAFKYFLKHVRGWWD